MHTEWARARSLLNLCDFVAPRSSGSSFIVAPLRTVERTWSLDFSGGWYDFTVTAGAFERRFAGRMETGQDSVSDPAMGMTVSETSVLAEPAGV